MGSTFLTPSAEAAANNGEITPSPHNSTRDRACDFEIQGLSARITSGIAGIAKRGKLPLAQ